MDKQSAVMLLDQYMRRSNSLDLDDRQQQRLIRKLSWLEKADINTVIQLVEEDEMYRGNAPQQKSTQQHPTQTREKMQEILGEFLNNDWAQLTGGAFPPIADGGNASSRINFKNFSELLNAETVIGRGTNLVSRPVLADIVMRLFTQGLLERPRIVERVVEVEKKVPLTRREEAKQNFKLDKVMNRAESPIKGINEEIAKEPAATQAQLEAQARHDLNENELMGDINAKIAQHAHHGRSHSATSYERQILENIRDAGIRAGTPNEKVNAQIDAKRNEMTKWGPQQALKELNPQLFTSQPKAAY